VDGVKVVFDGVGVVETGCDGVCDDVGTGLILLLAVVPAPHGGVLELLPIACCAGSESIMTGSLTQQGDLR